MNYTILDIETNGLLYEDGDKSIATKIHCMSVHSIKDGTVTTDTFINYDDMRRFLQNETCIIGHNLQRFDIPVLEKFLNIDLSGVRQIDTLALSWYLYPLEHEHGLDHWGEKLGIAKPKVADWQNDTIEVYMIRCQEDVKINVALWDLQLEYLKQIYGNNEDVDRFLKYISFKMDCAREQEEQKWRLDIERCKTNLEKLITDKNEKYEVLADLLPKVIKYKEVTRPNKLTKKDGSISVAGEKWFEYLRELGLPDYHVGTLRIPISEERGNPGSHQQLKSWLFSLGWEPDHYKQSKDKEGHVKEVPQIANEDGTDVSESVKELYEQVPDLVHLEGFFVLRHRIGILEGFLRDVNSQGYLQAQINGLTNTLRFKHTTIVNLPQIPKPYWEEVRGCLVTDEGYELCGSDMSGLEDNTKHHYMYFFDPEYVTQMRTPGFDPHIDISVRAKGISYDEGEFFKWYDRKGDYKYIPTKEFHITDNHVLDNSPTFDELLVLEASEQNRIAGKVIKPLRLKFKKGNFASVYGAGPAKLARTMGISIEEARAFHRAYWNRNKAVKQVAEATIVKSIGTQMWLFNPVSKFWYSLREEKDKFSTLNQGTGVYCFDTWVSKVRAFGIKIIGQFHDEIIFRLLLGTRELHSQKLNEAINLTNAQLQLNVPLRISIDYGDHYAAIH